jgi:5S rRNA maturation endonuclease (ribonuclease M5)
MRIDELLGRLEGVKRQSGGGFIARCPAHEDRKQSLSVGEGDDGRVLLTCFAGCEPAKVCEALGLTLADLFPPKERSAQREIVATYDYTDEDGELLYQVVRFAPKDFRQRKPDGAGGWAWKLGDTRRVLYHLPDVRTAVAAGLPVYVCEGEKDVAAIEEAGGVATTNPGGAGKWRPEYTAILKGADVIIVADRDEPGRKHAFEVAAALAGTAADIRVVEAVEGKDAADHLRAGKTLEELVPCHPGNERPSDLPVISLSQLLSEAPERPEYVWFGYLAKGAVTELAAKPKVGKTHLALQIAASVTKGYEVLDHATYTCPVLYLTEQGRTSYASQARKLKLGADWHVLLRASVRSLEWDQVGELVHAYVTQHHVGLVIVDTLSDWAGLRGDDENSAGAALAAMAPLRHIAEAGCAVLAVRHERKGTAEIGEASRGSSAFGGAMDILLSLRRTRGRGHENRRELLGVGRFDETPAAVTVELNGDNRYHMVAFGEAARAKEAEDLVLSVLPMNEAWAIPESEIRDKTELPHSTCSRALSDLVKRAVVGRAKQTREDGKGQVFAYWHEAAQ